MDNLHAIFKYDDKRTSAMRIKIGAYTISGVSALSSLTSAILANHFSESEFASKYIVASVAFGGLALAGYLAGRGAQKRQDRMSAEIDGILDDFVANRRR